MAWMSIWVRAYQSLYCRYIVLLYKQMCDQRKNEMVYREWLEEYGPYIIDYTPHFRMREEMTRTSHLLKITSKPNLLGIMH
jgi:hypothetical protein